MSSSIITLGFEVLWRGLWSTSPQLAGSGACPVLTLTLAVPVTPSGAQPQHGLCQAEQSLFRHMESAGSTSAQVTVQHDVF